MRLGKLLLAAFLLLTGASAWAQEEVAVYTYNDRPPFIVDKAKQDGIEFRLCQWLTKASGQYRFTLKVVTAGEAKAMVEKDFKGVLLGVNKVWFPEPVRARNLWTAPILWDRNLVLSQAKKKVEYTGPASLDGLKLAGTKGFAYPALTASIQEGRLQRLDNPTEIMALKMVAAGQADVTIVSEWTLLYEQLRDNLEGDFYQASKPFLEFERCILVPPSMKALHEHLDKLLADVRKNEGWNQATSL